MSKLISVNDLIGVTFYAKKPVPIQRKGFDGAPVVYTVPPGQPVGALFSYALPNEDRSSLYLIFKDTHGRPYYVAYQNDLFEKNLIEGQVEAKKKKTSTNWLQNLFGGQTKIVEKVAIGVGIYLIIKALK